MSQGPRGVSQALLLSKRNFEQSRLSTEEEQKALKTEFINSNGIVSPVKLILIAFLIIAAVSSLQLANNSHWPHVRAITNYFSIYVLGQDNLSIYDMGDNVDETYIEISTYSEMKEHFANLVNFVENYTEEGFANFQNASTQIIDAEFYYLDGKSVKMNLNFSEFKEAMLAINLREMLLSLRVMYFEIEFGNTEIVQEFKLILDYEIYSHGMVKLDMTTKYIPNSSNNSKIKVQNFLHILVRLFSGLLVIAYALESIRIKENPSSSKEFKKNSLYWCYSLMALNTISMTSIQLSPFCSILQLLPIFENHDSSNTLTYNFNVNLRYAWPIVFKVIIPVYMTLSGFILYSMIKYPGDYFDDYITGFFSYFYNNFQYGIYEIFIEVGKSGDSAYLLYIILYFYMVMVGSNLIPALFCTLIYKKMAEKELIRYVEAKLELIVCPHCKQENCSSDDYGIEININSPKSPYLKSGTTLKNSPVPNKKIERTRKISIEEEIGPNSPIFSPQLSLRSKHRKARDLITDLEDCFKGSNGNSLTWIRTRLEKIENVLEEF